MNFRSRALAYVGAGAAGLFATGAFAAPALAAEEADVSVKAASSKISVGAVAKLFRIDVKNAGPGVATNTELTVDLSGLDPDQIAIDFAALEDEDNVLKVTKAAEDEFVIAIGDIASGGSWAEPLPLFLEEGAEPGPAGTLKLAVSSGSADPDAANNVVSVPVEVTKSGVDVTTVAQDVYAIDDEGNTSPVLPGETAPQLWFLLNQGDMAARGVRLAITLPEKTSFVENYEGCTASADRRVLSCEFPDEVLAPGDAWGAGFPVKVSEDAPGPVTLTGGAVRGSGISVIEPAPEARAAAVTSTAPEGIEIMKVDEVLADIDPGDNDADFSVFVGEAGGTGGGSGDLPVTGVQAGLIGGVGLAVLAGGGALLVMSRRRKIVLVTPGDDTPTV